MIIFICLFAGFSLISTSQVIASSDRPDHHAQFGRMADHEHSEGEWMLSYRYMTMEMDGNRTGTSRLDTSEVLLSGTGSYRVAPTKMTMEMHMVGLMYVPSEKITLMLMLPFIENDMDHVTTTGSSFSTTSSGLGNISFSVASQFKSNGPLIEIGIAWPTGSLNERDLTPMGDTVLPYPMQTGSGTYDLSAGVGKTFFKESHSYGFKIKGVLPIGRNDENYSVGNKIGASGWYRKKLSSLISVSLKASYEVRGNYNGSDARYSMARITNLVPTVDPKLRGGDRLDVSVGFNLYLPGRNRLGFEYAWPVRQDLEGPQLETDWMLTIGWQHAL